MCLLCMTLCCCCLFRDRNADCTVFATVCKPSLAHSTGQHCPLQGDREEVEARHTQSSTLLFWLLSIRISVFHKPISIFLHFFQEKPHAHGRWMKMLNTFVCQRFVKSCGHKNWHIEHLFMMSVTILNVFIWLPFFYVFCFCMHCVEEPLLMQLELTNKCKV